jgi:hypothetical protein
VQNLLLMQSELTELEDKLKSLNATVIRGARVPGGSSENVQSRHGTAQRAQLMGLLQDKLESYSMLSY